MAVGVLQRCRGSRPTVLGMYGSEDALVDSLEGDRRADVEDVGHRVRAALGVDGVSSSADAASGG